MGFNFPNTPTVNQQYTPVGGPTYTWDGTVWKVTGTSGVVTADSYNRIVNGAMQHSQENARTAGTVNAYYPADQWRTAVAGSGYTATFASVDNVTDPVFAPAYLSIACSVAKASLAAGDACAVLENLEGSRMADLAWGTAKARPVVVRLTAWGMVGSFTMSIRNAAGDRSYVAPIATTATPTEFVIPVPGCTDGTWPTDSNAWGSIMVGVASGTTTQAPATNQWLTGNYWGHAGMSNLMAAVNNTLRVTHVALYADPNATGVPLPWVTPDYASELRACMRYYEKSYNSDILPGTVSGSGPTNGSRTQGTLSDYIQIVYKEPKRAVPTVAFFSPATGASGMVRDISGAVDVAASGASAGFNQVAAVWTPAAAGRLGQVHWVANTRM